MRWSDVVNYFDRNYKMDYDREAELITLTLEFTQRNMDRSQMVMLERIESQTGNDYVSILSRVGEISNNNLADALIYLNKKICGGLVLSTNRRYYYVRNSLPLKDLDIGTLVTLMELCAFSADDLELEFVGGDSQ